MLDVGHQSAGCGGDFWCGVVGHIIHDYEFVDPRSEVLKEPRKVAFLVPANDDSGKRWSEIGVR